MITAGQPVWVCQCRQLATSLSLRRLQVVIRWLQLLLVPQVTAASSASDAHVKFIAPVEGGHWEAIKLGRLARAQGSEPQAGNRGGEIVDLTGTGGAGIFCPLGDCEMSTQRLTNLKRFIRFHPAVVEEVATVQASLVAASIASLTDEPEGSEDSTTCIGMSGWGEG